MRIKVKRIDVPRLWRKLKHHPYSELTDFGVGIDMLSMQERMKRIGWDPSERITLYEGAILDGRHQLACAVEAEVEPLFQEFTGDNVSAVEFVHKKLMRQHLNDSQRGMVAAKLATLLPGRPSENGDISGENGETPPIGGIMSDGVTAAEAADLMNVGTRTVERAKAVTDGCIPAIQRAVRVGDMAVSDAASVAGFTAKQQRDALDALQAGQVSTLKEWADQNKKKKPAKKKAKATAAEPKPIKDQAGVEVPKKLRDVFADDGLADLALAVDAASNAVNYNALKKQAYKLAKIYPYLLIEQFDKHLLDAKESLQLAASSLSAGKAEYVCPKCAGEGCNRCRHGGHVPQHRYDELKSEE